MEASLTTGSVPPQYVSTTSVATKKGEYTTDHNVKLELRFCYTFKVLKLVRTNQLLYEIGADGDLHMWEFDLYDLWRAYIESQREDDQCDVSFCFCDVPVFSTRRYSLGQRVWWE